MVQFLLPRKGTETPKRDLDWAPLNSSIPLTPQGDGNTYLRATKNREDRCSIPLTPQGDGNIHIALPIIFGVGKVQFLLPRKGTETLKLALYHQKTQRRVQFLLPRKGRETVSKDEGRRMKDEKTLVYRPFF